MSSDGLFCPKKTSFPNVSEITETWLASSGISVPSQSNDEINEIRDNFLSDLPNPNEHLSWHSSPLSANHLVSSDDSSLNVCHRTNVTPNLGHMSHSKVLGTALGASDSLHNLASSDADEFSNIEDSSIACSIQEEEQSTNSASDTFSAVTQSSPHILGSSDNNLLETGI